MAEQHISVNMMARAVCVYHKKVTEWLNAVNVTVDNDLMHEINYVLDAVEIK